MGEPPRSPQPNLYSILGLPKSATVSDIGKAYRSLVTKWHPDKNSVNKDEAESKIKSFQEAYKVLSRKKGDETLSVDVPKNTKSPFQDEFGFNMSSPSTLSWEGTSRKSPTPTTTMADFLSRSYSETINPASPYILGAAGGLKGACRRSSSTPIIFSQSAIKKKPQPIEMKLECTLEELCHKCVKTINITRNVISDTGLIIQEEETLRIKVQPGWRRGTKLTFGGKGDERPGHFPADIIICIEEKTHPLFKRNGDDLELVIEVPLVQALTGCTIDIPLLGGENMSYTLDNDIICSGYEKIIVGQGMPKSSGGTRGNLLLKFLVKFPTELSPEQRSNIVSILNECS